MNIKKSIEPSSIVRERYTKYLYWKVRSFKNFFIRNFHLISVLFPIIIELVFIHSFWRRGMDNSSSTRTHCTREVREIEPWSSDLEKKKKSGWKEKIWMIIYKRLANPDDHLKKARPSGWSFAKGQPIRMIICKRPVHQVDHLQKAGPSGWSFAKGRPIRMVTWKRPAHQDDLFQKKQQ